MISSIVHSKAYLFALPPAERAQAVEAYAVSLRATFLAMAVVGLGALVAAWPIREVGLGAPAGLVPPVSPGFRRLADTAVRFPL